jgi:hypothetical protein
VLEIQEHPPSTQKILTVDPLAGGAVDPKASTINVKKISMTGPWAVVSEIQGRQTSTQKTSMTDP